MPFDRAGFDREVGLRLQRARKARGITQTELANRIGLPRPSYANIESGRQRIPVDVVWRAAVVLGVSLAVLVPEPAAHASDVLPPLPGSTSTVGVSPGSANLINAARVATGIE